MEIDEDSLDIQLTKTKSDAGDRIVPALVANIPILNVKSSDAEKINIEKEKAEGKIEEKVEKAKNVETDVKPKKSTKKSAKK